jgi:WD40 repeat protein
MGYRAFFSYARADDKTANWLHRQLDNYRTPKSLVSTEGALGPVPAKLHPIFRDRTDLQAGGHLDQSLQQSLEDSECLVVLCTPTSAKSHWVNHECETFIRLGRAERIFPVIADGIPDSGDPETECFPQALRGRGLLAADLREIKHAGGQVTGDGREMGRLKLIAGLLGVPLDALVQRERRRARIAMMAMSVAAVSFLGLAILATFFGIVAKRQEYLAESTLQRFFITSAWREFDGGSVRAAVQRALIGARLLEDQRDDAGEVLAAALFELGGSVPLPHVGGVLALFSPDGTRIVTATARVTGALADGSVRVWDRSGVLVHELPRWDAAVTALAISANSDLLAVGADDGRVRLISLASGEIVRDEQTAAAVSHVVFSPDGRSLAYVHAAGFSVLDIERWEMRVRRETSTQVLRISFAPDSSVLAATVARDEAAERRERERRQAQEPPDLSLSFGPSPYGPRLMLIDVATGAERALPNSGLSGQFAPVRHQVATGMVVVVANSGESLIWEGASSRQSVQANMSASEVCNATCAALFISSEVGYGIARFTIPLEPPDILVERGAVSRARWAPDGRRVAAGAGSGTIVSAGVYNASVTIENETRRTRRAHEGLITALDFAPNSSALVSAALDGTDPQLWGALSWPVIRQEESDGVGVGYNAHGDRFGVVDDRITITGADGAVRTFAPDATRRDRPFDDIRYDDNDVLRYSAGGRFIAAAIHNRVTVWNARDGALVFTREVAWDGRASLAFTPDEANLVIPGPGGQIIVLNASDGRELRSFVPQMLEQAGRPRQPRTQTYSVHVSPDGSEIASAGSDNLVIISEFATGRTLRQFAGHLLPPVDVQYSHDGAKIVTASLDQTARVWDAATGRLLLTLAGHEAPVYSARISPNGRIVATASIDGTIRIWSARSGRQLGSMLIDPTETFFDLAFSPDGGELAHWGPYDTWFIDVGLFALDFDALAHRACSSILSQGWRTLSREVIESDPLLQSQWADPERNVCEGITGHASR